MNNYERAIQDILDGCERDRREGYHNENRENIERELRAISAADVMAMAKIYRAPN
jgi:hypothetical protein